jgi:HSP20 family molecular chaperone IbpA
LLPLLAYDFCDSLESKGRHICSKDKNVIKKYEIINNENEYKLTIDVPGLKTSNLKANVGSDNISVSIYSDEIIDKESKASLVWSKSFQVDSKTTDLSQAKAYLSHGVLTITAQKKPRPLPQSVPVLTDTSSVLEAEKSLSSKSNNFTMTLDLPGVRETDVRVVLCNDKVIEIDATRLKRSNDGNAVKKLRYSESFEVNPDKVDTAQLKATLVNGVLTMCAPLKPRQEPIAIPIHQNSNNSIVETDKDKQYTICIDVPGIKAEDLSVKLMENGTLHVRGNRKAIGTGEEVTLMKSYNLPTKSVDVSKISATLSNGVLCVSAPRKPKVEPKELYIFTDGAGEEIEQKDHIGAQDVMDSKKDNRTLSDPDNNTQHGAETQN